MKKLETTRTRSKSRLALKRIERLFARRKDLPRLLEATAWLLVAWLVIDVLPFRLYRKLMKPRIREIDPQPHLQLQIIQKVSWCVEAASNRVPWRTVCFHRGLAALQMLSHAGIVAELHYGVAKSPQNGLEAHVWVTALGQMVVGGEQHEAYTVVGVFFGSNAYRKHDPSRKVNI